MIVGLSGGLISAMGAGVDLADPERLDSEPSTNGKLIGACESTWTGGGLEVASLSDWQSV